MLVLLPPLLLLLGPRTPLTLSRCRSARAQRRSPVSVAFAPGPRAASHLETRALGLLRKMHAVHKASGYMPIKRHATAAAARKKKQQQAAANPNPYEQELVPEEEPKEREREPAREKAGDRGDAGPGGRGAEKEKEGGGKEAGGAANGVGAAGGKRRAAASVDGAGAGAGGPSEKKARLEAKAAAGAGAATSPTGETRVFMLMHSFHSGIPRKASVSLAVARATSSALTWTGSMHVINPKALVHVN